MNMLYQVTYLLIYLWIWKKRNICKELIIIYNQNSQTIQFLNELFESQYSRT